MIIEGKYKEAKEYVKKFWLKLNKTKIDYIKKHYDVDFVIREKYLPISGLEIFFTNKAYFVYRIQ